jgi:hypothetical protein
MWGIKLMKKRQSSDFSMSFIFLCKEASCFSSPALKISALQPREQLNAFFYLGWGTGWFCGI